MNLRIKELKIHHEHAQQVARERDIQRQIREQLREEEKAQRERDATQKAAEAEERKARAAVVAAEAKLREAHGKTRTKLELQIEQLQRRLDEASANKARAVSQAQLTRSGYVYVISNIGAFGEGVYKVGMTRRLEPLDRVRELGDASVPFRFDVHAMIYSTDAPSLERALHDELHDKRVNKVNHRKEFFSATLEDIQAAVANQGELGEIAWTEVPEASDYRTTLMLMQQSNPESGKAYAISSVS